MTRVESLLEKVLQRMGNGDACDRQPSPSLVDHNNRGASPPAITPSAHENAPVLSLFNNTVLGSHQPDTQHQSSRNDIADPEVQNLRANLLAFLPSQTTVNKLADENNSWWLIRVQCFGDEEKSLLSKPVAALRKSHPVVIAKALLWVIVCLQQLPPRYDTSSLGLPCSPLQFTQQCIALVTTSICSHNSMIRNVDGLECLVLQGVFYNNDGKLRRAWLSYRHAQNVAQLMGLHRPTPASQEGSTSLARAKGIWRHIVFADRYLSLMLGMCHGVGDGALDQQSASQNIETPHMNRLFVAAGSIIERNQTFPTYSPDMMRKTQTIDAELGDIDPTTINTDGIDPSAKTPELAQCYAKLMTQMWHFQLTAWLHLPLMLDSSTHKRYEYSRQSCLEASRHMITCYIAIRSLTGQSFCCKSLDFQAFTAAVTLLINLLGSENRQKPTPEDWEPANKVMDILEQLAQAQPDEVASRALSVLQTLKNLSSGRTDTSSNGAERNPEEESNRLKLVIPYFGTVFLDRRINSSDAPDSSRLLQIAPNVVEGTQTASSQEVIPPDPGSVRLDDINFFPGVEAGPELISELWSTDPSLTQSPFLADFSGGWDWGFI
ncbi:hypothetical protein P170DRAFT_487885 [Aspergillus steynii IBT 23096]|uniref:Transcription factor domain-containing protein n=1 Tax=Aspergillus steynii IBT 23096 TaxID=1392250 RepID=A0A2I2GFL2_9EURO|nr:uncharacterized protein P170DRAFT_487885 [Aspergillus steynii IBT 23096]PLB51670.1 hypothetical protein P170DRAFT_487885 [Aspergillus steynii IBT 23096]